MNRRAIFSLTALCFAMFSCGQFTFNDTKGAKVVASYGDKKLCLRDVVGLSTPNLTAEDSLSIIENYAEYWLRNEVVADYSQEKYAFRSDEVDKLIEEYRRSLFTEFFEKEYTKGIGEFVTDDEISKYYSENKQKFTLSSNIVKAQIVTIPKNYVDATLLKKKLASSNRDDFDDIVSIAERDKLIVRDYSQAWVYFNDIVSYVPFTGSVTGFLTEGKFFEATDDHFRYSLKILDYKLKGDISPRELVEELIKRAIIIERRKNRVQQVKDSLYNDAVQRGDAEIKDLK